MKERIINEYFKFKLARKGIKLLGHRGTLYYGVDKDDWWYFYMAYGLTLIPIKECEDKLDALFAYNVLLNKYN